MIEFDFRFNIKEEELNKLDVKYILKTYEGTIKEIPIPSKEENNRIFKKIELNLQETNFATSNVMGLVKSHKIINEYEFICLLINPEDILNIKNYPIDFVKFDLTKKQEFKKGTIRNLLYEQKKYIEISFKHFLSNKEYFLQNINSLMEITKGKGLIFSSECKRETEYKSFIEKFSLLMLSVLDFNGKFNIKPIYTNQLEMENYHLNVFYELIKKKCFNEGLGVVSADTKKGKVLINDKILPYFT